MATDKKSFILYSDLIHTVKKMPKDKAGELFLTILQYVNDENPVVEDMLIDLVFEPIKHQMKRDLIKYEGKRESWSKAGSASAEARRVKKELNERSTDSTYVELCSTDSTVNVNDNVNDNVNVNVINKIPFSEFWELYDKKVGSKSKCENKWNKLSLDVQKKIIDTLPTFKSSIRDKQYQPHPETYLNGARWNDEIIIPFRQSLNLEQKYKYKFPISPTTYEDRFETIDTYKKHKRLVDGMGGGLVILLPENSPLKNI